MTTKLIDMNDSNQKTQDNKINYTEVTIIPFMTILYFLKLIS